MLGRSDKSRGDDSNEARAGAQGEGPRLATRGEVTGAMATVFFQRFAKVTATDFAEATGDEDASRLRLPGTALSIPVACASHKSTVQSAKAASRLDVGQLYAYSAGGAL